MQSTQPNNITNYPQAITNTPYPMPFQGQTASHMYVPIYPVCPECESGSLNLIETIIDRITSAIVRVIDELVEAIRIIFEGEPYAPVAENQPQQISAFGPIAPQMALPSAPPLSQMNPLSSVGKAISAPKTDKKISMYFDMGIFSAQLWPFLEWSTNPPTFNMAAYEQVLRGSLFPQMQAAGIDQINLAFAQIASVDNLLVGGQGSSAYDAIGQMLLDFPGAFQTFIQVAREEFNMKIDLSFGGEDGNSMQICQEGETATEQGLKVVRLMEMYNIDSVDFDLENTLIATSNPPQDIIDFFYAIKTGLANTAPDKKSTLTIEGGIADWAARGTGALSMLFYDQEGNRIFKSLFDKLRLMPYSENQYYLDATNYNNCGWSIEGWLNLLGPDFSASDLAIGFEDNVPYQNPAASASGYHYNIDSNDPGVAAAEIDQQLQGQLINDGYGELDERYFWPDSAHFAHQKGIWSRYQIFSDNTMNFDLDVVGSYYNKINGIQRRAFS